MIICTLRLKLQRSLMHQKSIYSVYMVVVALVFSLGGCASHYPAAVSPEEIQTDISAGQDVRLEWLDVPDNMGIEPGSLTVQALSAEGTTIIGTARRFGGDSHGKGQDTAALEVFRWDLASDGSGGWIWLGISDTFRDNATGDIENFPVGADETASVIFGRHWIWQKGHAQLTNLGQQFWAYTLNGQGQVLGVATDNRIALLDTDGKVLRQWPAHELFDLDGQGHLRGKLWFSGDGAAVVSTLNICLKINGCEQAQFIHWSPDNGEQVVAAQIPPMETTFIQGDPGPQRLSRNGLWLAGFAGRSLYSWNTRSGQMLLLGGFEHGGNVTGISDDGQIVIGSTIDAVSSEPRDWIWTATEGLGWLDEWLRDHGVSQAESLQGLQSRFISANRRSLYGVSGFPQQGQGIRWWRAVLPEQLRVLVH